MLFLKPYLSAFGLAANPLTIIKTTNAIVASAKDTVSAAARTLSWRCVLLIMVHLLTCLSNLRLVIFGDIATATG